MYHANVLSDNISPALALLAEKHLSVTVPNIDFIHIKETQHESYLSFIIDNKLSLNQHIDDMSKKQPICKIYVVVTSTCALKNLKKRHIIYIYIVHPHLEYASTCWNPYTKRKIYKLEAA